MQPNFKKTAVNNLCIPLAFPTANHNTSMSTQLLSICDGKIVSFCLFLKLAKVDHTTRNSGW